MEERSKTDLEGETKDRLIRREDVNLGVEEEESFERSEQHRFGREEEDLFTVEEEEEEDTFGEER